MVNNDISARNARSLTLGVMKGNDMTSFLYGSVTGYRENFSNDICLVAYRNNGIRCTQLYRLSNNEHYEEIRMSLLARIGYQ